MMTVPIPLLLLCFSVSWGRGNANNIFRRRCPNGGRHHECPKEENVYSPPMPPRATFPPTTPAPTPVPTTRTSTASPSLAPTESGLDDTSSPSIQPSTMPTTIMTTTAPSQSPSVVSSALPTLSPIPSASPTSLPTAVLSSAPSDSNAPTITLSELPTLSPSQSPTTTSVPSPLPSNVPTAVQSLPPTTTPEPSPVPTLASSASLSPSFPVSGQNSNTQQVTSIPTQSPSQEVECEVDQAGTFGTSAGNALIVDFAYELETTALQPLSDVIAPLERSFNNRLLPELFASTCGRFRRGLRIRQLRAVGVSPLPTDIPLTNVACGQFESGNKCTVMKGELTVFHDGSTAEFKTLVLAVLKEGMDNRDFDNAHANIKRVSYVELQSVTKAGAGDDTTTQVGGDDNGNPVLWGVIAGILALILILLGLLLRKKRKDEREDEAEWSDSAAPLAGSFSTA